MNHLNQIYNPEGSDLRKAQMRMLDILVVFDEICCRHNIPYWLDAGTLLGARRHRGFIPWDDDVDVMMLHRDYKKSLKILKRELPEQFRIVHHNNDNNHRYCWAQIRDTHSTILTHDNKEQIFDLKYRGLFIDIFPVQPILSIRLKYQFDRIPARFVTRKFSKNRLTRLFNTAVGLLYPLYWLAILINRGIPALLRFDKLTYSPGIFFYFCYNKKDIFPLKKIEFEGHQFNCPGNTDAFLTCVYGPDFMTLPPEDQRVVHSINIEIH